ncbi:MAG: universal stress protein [Blastochloris sp.]|nr:universal stress protein [Blastochloris sp.]
MKPILVQMANPPWTLQAIHFACAMARNHGTTVILLRLMPVHHPNYLGESYGGCMPTPKEDDALREYEATAEDYGVEFVIQPMQSAATLSAIVDAAEQLDVEMVFAYIASSRVPFWEKLQTWWLTHQLAAAHRQLFTLARLPHANQPAPLVITESEGRVLHSDV